MAITSIGLRGSNSFSTGNNTSLAVTTGTAISAGRIVLVVVTSRTAGLVTGMTDSVGGNTWSMLSDYLNTTNGNIRTSIWMCRLTNALLSTSTITASWSTNESDGCMYAWEFSVGAGNTLQQASTAVGNEVNGANDFGSVSFSSLTNKEYLFFRGLGKQCNTTTAITVTTSYTTHGLTLRSRNNANAAIIRGEHRILTATGSTSNPTLAVSGNSAGIFLALEEVAFSTTYSYTIDDSISVTDSASREESFERATNDTATVTDSGTESTTIEKVIATDSVSVTDQLLSTGEEFRDINDSVTVTDSLTRDGTTWNRTIDETITVTDQGLSTGDKLREIGDSITVTDTGTKELQFERALSDSATISDEATPTGDFPNLSGIALSLFIVSPYKGPSWYGRDSLSGTSLTHDLATAGDDPNIGSTYNGRTSSVWVAYVPPTHPLQFRPRFFFERPNYNGLTGVWTGRHIDGNGGKPALLILAGTGGTVKPYESGGAMKGVASTTDYLYDNTKFATSAKGTLSDWTGSGAKHLYVRLRTTSITSTATFYSAHIAIGDTGQYVAIGLKKNGSAFEAGFLDYGGAVNTAVVDISHVVDSNGAGEFSIQAKRTSAGDLFIRVNDEAWQAGTTGTSATSNTTGLMCVGGASYGSVINGEVLAVATWKTTAVADDDSVWLGTWSPRTMPSDMSTAPTLVHFPRRWNENGTSGAGAWTPSDGTAQTGAYVRDSGTGPTATSWPQAVNASEPTWNTASPDFEDGTTDWHYVSGKTADNVFGVGTEARTIWAWVRTESIVLNSGNYNTNHVIICEGGNKLGLSLRRTGSGPYQYFADYYLDDGSVKVATVEITSVVDANGSGEFTITARNQSGASGQMAICLNGGSWTNGNTVGDITATASNSPVVGRNASDANAGIDGVILGLATWKNYAFNDTDRDNMEVAAQALISHRDARVFLARGSCQSGTQYTISAVSAGLNDGFYSLYSGASEQGVGWTFFGLGRRISAVTFYVRKSGSPTGNLTISIYAADGVFDSTSTKPTGSPITSATYDVSTLTTSFATIGPAFSSPAVLEANKSYVATITYSGGDASNYIDVAIDTTSPTYDWNVGYLLTHNGSSWAYVGFNYMAVGQVQVANAIHWDSWTGPAGYATTSTGPNQLLTTLGQVPDFIPANNDKLGLGLQVLDLVGNDDCSGYAVVDLDAISAAAANIWQDDAIWADDGGGNIGLHVHTVSGTPYAVFYQWNGSAAKVASAQLPATTGMMFIAWRKWNGYLWISTDGATWTQGDAMGTFANGGQELMLFRNGYASKTTDGRCYEFCLEQPGVARDGPWLKGAYLRAQEMYEVL